jgi:hypothetical protein
MALYVMVLQYSPDRCPAADPQMGSMLLAHLAPENALSHGVKVDAEAVVGRRGCSSEAAS